MITFMFWVVTWIAFGVMTLAALSAYDLIDTKSNEAIPPALVVMTWPIGAGYFIAVRSNWLLHKVVELSTELHRLRVKFYFVDAAPQTEECGTKTCRRTSKT